MTMYRDYLNRTAIGKKILNIEFRLILFASYVLFLILAWFKEHSWIPVLYVHLTFVFIFSLFYFRRQFLYVFAAPLVAVFIPFEQYKISRFLRKNKINTPSEVAIVLGHSDWTKLEAWIKPNSTLSELKSLAKYLESKKQDFSFYPTASLEDVEKIMRNTDIKEVYFFGHGSSHMFQLCTDEILYYCEFNNERYKKRFVHQVHCGTPDGKSLVDYVVPEENKKECFLFREPISGLRIEKEFRNKTRENTLRD